jgi:hypothetical protein
MNTASNERRFGREDIVFRRLKFFTALASCSLLLITAPAFALSHSSSVTQAAGRQTVQVQSVSGHIMSVAGNTFTIQTAASQNAAGQGQNRITFTIDQDTVVEGKIEVGSRADVTYRRQDGNNIAVSIRISPQS